MIEQPTEVTHVVKLAETGRMIKVRHGTGLLDVVHGAGIHIAATCGGKGACGQCRVILSGRICEPTPADEKHLTPAELARGIRLACCAQVIGDCTVVLTAGAADLKARLQVDGVEDHFDVNPMVRARHVKLAPVTHSDTRADLERLFQSLVDQYGLEQPSADHCVVAQLSGCVREQDWELAACLRDSELVAVLPPSAPPMGLAVDLGTTKVGGYLMDLTTGETVASAGMLNPQSRFGGDVMSRMQHAATQAGQAGLVEAIRGGINGLLRELCEAAGVDPLRVVDGCIVANTAMIHLLLDLPTRQLSHAPYVAASLSGFDVKARDLALDMASGAYIHIPPAVGGFVGADHVAMILAADIDQLEGINVGIDIGTNTEIVIQRAGVSQLLCASCPSGPAFEGAHVANGMKAADGAIESIRLTDTLEARCETIGNAPAIGLCGSGMIDALAELYRCGVLNRRGRFEQDDTGVPKDFCLVPASDSGTGKAIRISQQDINTLQLAKGAIRAGIETLLDAAGIGHAEVTGVFIAGAFGSYINLTHAVKIGLIPVLPNADHYQIGNAAAVGAREALVDRSARKRAIRIARRSRHVDLTHHKKFNRHFAEGMLFPEPGRG